MDLPKRGFLFAFAKHSIRWLGIKGARGQNDRGRKDGVERLVRVSREIGRLCNSPDDKAGPLRIAGRLVFGNAGPEEQSGTLRLRRADSVFLQAAIKRAPAQPKIPCREQSISVVPGQRAVDQENFCRV